MKIYKKCVCCGKIMFLLLGSDFGNEVEFGSAFGSKDNVPHQDTNHEQDWDYLIKFLNGLKDSHGEVFISLKPKEKDKLPKEILQWTENYQEKEKPKDWTKWKDIDRDFTEELVQEWIKYGFTYETCADWISIGFKPTKAEYAYWLDKIVKITSDYYLNHTSPEDQAGLKEQFDEYKKNK